MLHSLLDLWLFGDEALDFFHDFELSLTGMLPGLALHHNVPDRVPLPVLLYVHLLIVGHIRDIAGLLSLLLLSALFVKALLVPLSG